MIYENRGFFYRGMDYVFSRWVEVMRLDAFVAQETTPPSATATSWCGAWHERLEILLRLQV